MSIFFDNKNKGNIGKLIHVGAGSGIDLNGYLDQHFTEIVLLEPIPKVFKQLTSKIEKLNKKKSACKLSALNFALSSTTNTDKTEQEKNFYITQPNRYSGFHKATKLKTLFQNFKTEQEINVNTISFTDLITKAALNKDKSNALVLQINGGEFDVLAQAKADELMLFSSIVIQQAKNNYFEQAKASSDLVTLMESKGFPLMLEVSKDAVFSNLAFRKDKRTLELKILNEKSEVQSKRIAELEKLVQSKNESDEVVNKLNDLFEQVKHQNSVMKKHHDNIISKQRYGFNNSVKQLESFIGVQRYLETGQLSMEYHGWPVSSDVALFLMGKIEDNNYDLIIEFGSGTSTQLFAKAINNQMKAQTKHLGDDLVFISHDKKGESTLPSLPDELPHRIVSFEHNKKYYEKTLAGLKVGKLSHLVDLVHAPLIEMKIEKEDYLYYSCGKKLSQLASIYAERTAKILVLIDGPPGETGPLARLPAIPMLLNFLGKHQLDIVLDDYKRKEEIETVERWKKQFDKRYLEYNEEIVTCEKGVFFCRVNP